MKHRDCSPRYRAAWEFYTTVVAKIDRTDTSERANDAHHGDGGTFFACQRQLGVCGAAGWEERDDDEGASGGVLEWEHTV